MSKPKTHSRIITNFISLAVTKDKFNTKYQTSGSVQIGDKICTIRFTSSDHNIANKHMQYMNKFVVSKAYLSSTYFEHNGRKYFPIKDITNCEPVILQLSSGSKVVLFLIEEENNMYKFEVAKEESYRKHFA